MPVSNLYELNPFTDTPEELRDEINARLRDYNDYHRDAELTGLPVYIGPNGFSHDKRIATVTTNTTLSSTHRHVICDTSGGSVTITLPAVATSTGYEYYIKKETTDANTVTIDANLSETIDGQTTWVLNFPRACMHLICDGDEWHIMGIVNGAN